MAETIKDNQIAAGHDNEAGFNNIETLADSNGEYFRAVDDFPNYRDGVLVLRGDGISVMQGEKSVIWRNPITKAQWYYIYNTLLSNAYSGLVTIRTQTLVEGTYSNWNATLTIKPMEDYQAVGDWLQDFEWVFTQMEAT